jgi:hypothetical protein
MRLVGLGLALPSILCLGAQPKGWHCTKDDPATKKHVLDVSAESFDQTPDGRTKYLHSVTARIYGSDGNTAQVIESKEAVANFETGTLRYGPDLKSVLSLKP